MNWWREALISGLAFSARKYLPECGEESLISFATCTNTWEGGNYYRAQNLFEDAEIRSARHSATERYARLNITMGNILEQYKRQLKEKRIEIGILREISETINYHWDLKDILQSVIKIVHSYTKSDSCLIYLIEGQQLVLQASQNPHRSLLGRITLKKNEGITGWVARHNKTVMLPTKAHEDERFKIFNDLPEDQFESFLSTPIVFRNKVIGVINVQNRHRRRYSKEEILFLETVARQVGGAIENARLLSETNVLKDALEARKVVEKAKGILMRTRGLTEIEAHRLLNKKCMNARKTLKEMAEAIILSNDL